MPCNLYFLVDKGNSAQSTEQNSLVSAQNQNGSLSQSGMSQELRIPASVHPVLLANGTWFVVNHVVINWNYQQ